MNYNFLILNHPTKQRPQTSNSKRWERLYSLEKVKLNKQEEKRKNQYEEQLKKENTYCTFSPKLNKTKYKSFLLEMPMSQRLNHYSKKKEIKINSLHQVEIKKENEELSFSPKIIKNYKLELDVAENVLQNPNSYVNFVDRLKQMRSFVDKEKNKQINAVGMGIQWKNQITVPKGPSFLTRPKLNRSLSTNYNVNQFNEVSPSNSKNESMSKFFPSSTSRNNLEEKYIKKEKVDYDSIFNFQKSAVKLNRPMVYKDAKKILHKELHENNR